MSWHLTLPSRTADIKVKEPDFAALGRGEEVFLPPRFMSVNEAAAQLLQVASERAEPVYTAATLCVGMARLGQPDQRIACCSLQQMMSVDLGGPLHCLVIVGQTHDLEMEVGIYICSIHLCIGFFITEYPSGLLSPPQILRCRC